MLLQRLDVERHLWFGAHSDVIDWILETGFRREFHITNVYGRGLYFGDNARVSHWFSQPDDGERKMIYGRVVVGDFVQGRASHERQQLKDGVVEVNRLKNPTMIVIRRDSHVAPEFVLTYRRRVH